MNIEDARILRVVRDGGQVVAWKQAAAASGLSPAEFREAVRRLVKASLLEQADPGDDRPRLRLTEGGDRELQRILARQPVGSMRFSLRTSAESRREALSVVLSQEGRVLAEGHIAVSPYRLSAIQYLLLYDPGSVNSRVATRASIDIGNSLIPSCLVCSSGAMSDPARSAAGCRMCIRGNLLSELGRLSAGQWVTVELDVTSPWTRVPWELGALSPASYLALDPRVSIMRKSTVEPLLGTVDGLVTVLVAMPRAQESNFAREAHRILDVLSSNQSDQRSFTVNIAAEVRSAEQLRHQIMASGARVVHLIGHGTLEGVRLADGVVNWLGIAEAVSGLGVELMVVGSCFGATTWGTDLSGASLGLQLSRSGATNVIAFEGRAESEHAEAFAVAFYTSLARWGSIDRAVQAGRAALVSGAPFLQWGQVVMFRGC